MCQSKLELKLNKKWCYINVKLVPNAYIKQISYENNELSWVSQPYKITTVNNNNNKLVWFINCYAKNKIKDCAYSNIAVNKERTVRRVNEYDEQILTEYRRVNGVNKQHSGPFNMNSKMHEAYFFWAIGQVIYNFWKCVHCYSVAKRHTMSITT